MTYQELNSKSLDKAIKALQDEITKLGTPKNSKTKTKIEKYNAAIKVFENAKSKLSSVIAQLKKTPDPLSTSDPQESYFDTLFKGKEDAVTLTYIGSVLTGKGLNIADFDKSGIDESKVDMAKINLNHNFIDTTKEFTDDVAKGKGKAVGLTNALLGIGIADIATKGITTLLAKKGIMDGSLSLFGLLGRGFEAIPGILPSIQAGASTIFAACPMGWALLGGAVALKVIPVVKRAVDKIRANLKSDYGAQDRFNANMSKILADQPQLV
ncbi:MAG: hypothetical protein J6A51_01935 [Clostridia bacterium]|nr:hypothetical protein [Clostridia bacterium]